MKENKSLGNRQYTYA